MKRSVFFSAIICFLLNSLCQAQPGYITTIAGNGYFGYGGDGGPATAAKITSLSVFVDASGSIYISDNWVGIIRKVDHRGIISTFAGGGSSSADWIPATNASLVLSPGGQMAADPSGNIYIIDSTRVRKISIATGIISTVAGKTFSGYGGDGGPASAATLNGPVGLCFDRSANLYIADERNFRIRKINTSGIISTFAGIGISGNSGDGGPATAAQLKSPDGLCIDAAGNMYVADRYAYRIRRIDPSGTIVTYAGNGAPGSTGDGGIATAASFSGVAHLSTDSYGNLYFGDAHDNRVRVVTTAGIINTFAGGGISPGSGIPATSVKLSSVWGIATDMSNDLFIADSVLVRKVTGEPPLGISPDSFYLRTNNLCNGPEQTIRTYSHVPGSYVITDYGDGIVDSSTILKYHMYGGFAKISHTYKSTGTYKITNVLYNGIKAIDTQISYYPYTFCRSLPVRIYAETNSNCIMDKGETHILLPSLAEVDSNGIKVGTISAFSGFNYNAYAPSGTVYSFKLISLPGFLNLDCPATGRITDTVLATTTYYPEKYFGVSCPTGTKFDFGLNIAVAGTGRHLQLGNIYAYNNGCVGPSATVTMHYSPKWPSGVLVAKPTPTAVSSHSATWNIGTLAAGDPPFTISYILDAPKPYPLKVGDTVHSTFVIAPTSGDVNTTNNTIFRIDTAKSSFDPNAIYAKPAGCIPVGTNTLEYTIMFENMGNDTAHNVYLMDTLDNTLDAATLRIVMASANMNFGILKDGPYTIAKFDFPNIKLLDSSHHGLCDGTVIYTIDMQKGLASDTRIYNRAGIYFDVNEVVLTNTSENIIGCPPLAIDNLPEIAAVNLYPNPTTDELTITTGKQYSSFTITNSIGQVMMEQPITDAQTKVSIKALPAGLYYLSLRGSEGVMVQKFVKL